MIALITPWTSSSSSELSASSSLPRPFLNDLAPDGRYLRRGK